MSNHQQDLNECLDNLGNYHTNKDQTIGSVIAKAAFLIAQGAHLVDRNATESGAKAEDSQDEKVEAQRA